MLCATLHCAAWRPHGSSWHCTLGCWSGREKAFLHYIMDTHVEAVYHRGHTERCIWNEASEPAEVRASSNCLSSAWPSATEQRRTTASKCHSKQLCSVAAARHPPVWPCTQSELRHCLHAVQCCAAAYWLSCLELACDALTGWRYGYRPQHSKAVCDIAPTAASSCKCSLRPAQYGGAAAAGSQPWPAQEGIAP